MHSTDSDSRRLFECIHRHIHTAFWVHSFDFESFTISMHTRAQYTFEFMQNTLTNLCTIRHAWLSRLNQRVTESSQAHWKLHIHISRHHDLTLTMWVPVRVRCKCRGRNLFQLKRVIHIHIAHTHSPSRSIYTMNARICEEWALLCCVSYVFEYWVKNFSQSFWLWFDSWWRPNKMKISLDSIVLLPTPPLTAFAYSPTFRHSQITKDNSFVKIE